MMSNKEKKALDTVKSITEDDLLNRWEGPEEAYNAIQTVLNLIEKQSEEIEELKEDNQRYKRIASQKLDDIEEFRKNECEHRCIRNAEVLELKEYYQENYTPNDKIKAKIEEIDNTGIDVDWEQVNYINRELDRAKIEVLRELLEKE